MGKDQKSEGKIKMEKDVKNYLYSEIKFWDEEKDENILPVLRKYENYELDKLFTNYSMWMTDKRDKVKRIIHLMVLKALILKELELLNYEKFSYFFNDLIREFEKIQERLDHLENLFKVHRHKGYNSMFTDLPV
jgi:hypothetical protein